ncbi:unnamed protein product [Effrenium voratum]|uniref:RRM domain-containing protein n=1 Tax=Effrenium voratum TaxID=2562239 RepID=A0AA36HRE0_9DINO|nr:unnamed protein product [Effrenium voratum]
MGRRLFEHFGPIRSQKLCSGYGFVEFEMKESSQMAIQSLHGTQLRDRVLQVKVAANSNYSTRPVRLQVCGLMGASEAEVRRLFARFDVSAVSVSSTGGAFVNVASPSAAQEAVRVLDGCDWHGSKLQVKFRSSVSGAP